MESAECAPTEATRPALAWVAAVDDLAGLDGYRPLLTAMSASLADQGAAAVGLALADVNDALTVRIIALAEARLGPPPCAYAWLVLGSGGRREEWLHSDQDNAVAYEDADAGPYFADLAETVVSALADAGLPRCPGGYVATRWRHPLGEWERIFRAWFTRPDPQGLVDAEVLLDFRTVHGALPLVRLEEIVRTGGDRPRFAVRMARAAVTFEPPLGMFGRIRVDRGRLDLKRAGIAGIVLLARLYALAAGSTVRPTVDRLAAAAAGGTLSLGGAARLTDAYRVLLDLRLRHGNDLRLDALDAERRQELARALRAVRDLQEVTALRYRTDAVS